MEFPWTLQIVPFEIILSDSVIFHDSLLLPSQLVVDTL